MQRSSTPDYSPVTDQEAVQEMDRLISEYEHGLLWGVYDDEERRIALNMIRCLKKQRDAHMKKHEYNLRKRK